MPSPTREFVQETRRRAEAGEPSAQCNLGIFHAFGRGVPQDLQVAAKWYRRAAEQGDAQAQYNLAVQIGEGQGVPEDHEEAFRWSLRAAEQGHVIAQFNVAISCGQGIGTAEDQVEALKWIILSARGGNAEAAAVRNSVIQQYSQEQIGEAERRAAAWQPKMERNDQDLNRRIVTENPI
ncbi:MAG: tetratricopeptide repeat protein [Terriglobales bacterium]|jgi:uncharacterized protein